MRKSFKRCCEASRHWQRRAWEENRHDGQTRRNSIATFKERRHHCPMGNGRLKSMIPDLFSTASREHVESATSSPRHVLPSDLPTAIKHLDDQELDQLFAAVVAERLQRGMKSPVPDKIPNKRSVEATAVSLTPGKLSAVRAAFKAGVTPTKIAKEFGLSQADVRSVIASDKR
jgi:hypothetical protein